MSSIKYPLVGGRVARVTRLDLCGRPAYGDKVFVVSEGFVSVAVTANYDDGEAVEVENFNGKKCVNRRPRPELLDESVDAVFCLVDPELYTAVTGFPPIVDPATGDTIGFRKDRAIRPHETKWALEVWSEAFGDEGCEDDEEFPFGYLLWAFLSGGKLSDYTIENGAVTFGITGATTNDGSQWGAGPYEVQTDAGGTPDVLQDPVTEKETGRVFRTLVPPPLETNGLVPLDDPDNGAATGADAGSPGVWTPTGAVRPDDLAELQAGAYTASPLIAWTTGQFVILGDGSFAHWDGDSWEAGKAP